MLFCGAGLGPNPLRGALNKLKGETSVEIVKKGRPRLYPVGFAYHKAYYQKNREKILLRQQRLAPDKRREYHAKYSISTKGIFANAKVVAKEREIPFSLTLGEFTIVRGKQCFYCQGPLPTKGVGLDRINHKKGYILGNVVPSCWDCNTIKGDKFTMEETKVMVQALLEYRKNAPKSV